MDNQLFKTLSAAVLAAGMLFPALAPAQEARDSRFYLGAGAGQATIDDDQCATTGALGSADLDGGGDFNDAVVAAGCDDQVVSFGGFAGYRLSDNFAAEIGFVFANEFVQKGSVQFNGTGASENHNLQLDVQTVFLGAVVHFPFTTSAETSVFAKAGMHFWEAEISAPSLRNADKVKFDDNDPYFGLGIQHMLSDKLGLQGEWVRYTANWESGVTFNGIELSDKADIDVFGMNFIYLL